MSRKSCAIWLAIAVTSAGASFSGLQFERAEAARYALIVHGTDGAGSLGSVLASRYGFEVVELVGETRADINDAMGDIYERVRPYDQLVVHFSLPVMRAERSYFVPVNADPEESWTLLDHREIVDWLNAMPTGGVFATYPSCGGEAADRLLDELAYGDRPGPVEVLLACDYEALRTARRDPDVGFSEWRGLAVAEAISDALRDAAGPNDGGEAGQFAVTSSELTKRVAGSLEGFDVKLSVVPLSQVPQFRFAHIGTVDEYRSRYEQAGDYRTLIAVIQDYLAAAGGEPSASPGLVTLLRDIALDPGAAATSASLESKEALQLRSYAVDGLVRLGGEDARSALREIGSGASDSELIRGTAISALAADTTAEDRDTLRNALEDDDAGVREAAVRGLVRARDEGAAARLAQLLPGETDLRVRISMVQGLSSFRREEDRELFTSLLDSEDWGTRKEAVAALSGLAPDVATNRRFLWILGNDEVTSLRETAAYALARTAIASQQEEIVDGLRDALENATEKGVPSETVRGAAASSLGRIGGPEAERALLGALAGRENSERLRIAAAAGLGRMKSAAAVPTLAAVASGRQERATPLALRRAAITALGTIGTPEVAGPLYAALEDRDGYLRQEAERWVRELGIKPPKPELDGLIEALGSPQRAERQTAEETLAASSDPAVIDRVIEALDDNSESPLAWNRRLGAIEVLGMSVSDEIRIVEALAASSTDGNPTIRAAAVRALGGRGESATRWVLQATDDKFEEVRLAAVSALAEIGTEVAISNLEKMAKADASPQVRRAASEALTPSKFLYSAPKFRSKGG